VWHSFAHRDGAGDGAPWTVIGMMPVRNICHYPYKGRAGPRKGQRRVGEGTGALDRSPEPLP